MRDVSTNGLTLSSPYVESERVEHRAEKKDRVEREEADVYVHARVRVGIRTVVCVQRGLFSD